MCLINLSATAAGYEVHTITCSTTMKEYYVGCYEEEESKLRVILYLNVLHYKLRVEKGLVLCVK